MRLPLYVVLLATVTAVHAAQEWTAEDFIPISPAAAPPVSLAVQRDGDRLRIAVEAMSFAADGGDTKVELGLSAGKPVVLGVKDAQVVRNGRMVRHVFQVPLSAVGNDLKNLRLGLAVAWSGGPDGADRQRERLRHLGGAAHAGLSPQAGDWQPFDLDEHATRVADRRARIEIPLDQPEDGKATVVIEDAASGKRLRNLIGGAPMAKGAQRIAWDGVDDQGIVVTPGSYRWRAISHPGIVPRYVMNFANGDNTPEQFGGWGPNHTTITEFATGGQWTIAAAPMTEGGDAIVVLDAEGRKLRGMSPPMGMGMWRIAPAIEGDTLYIANDGMAWGDNFDERDPKSIGRFKITLARFDLTNGHLKEWKGKRFIELSSVEVGPGAADKDWKTVSLAGMAVMAGKLYITDRRRNLITVVDTVSGEKTDEIPLPQPGALTATNGKLYGVSAGAVVTIDPASKRATPIIPAGAAKPKRLAVDTKGKIYLTDEGSGVVRVFNPDGMTAGTIGKPGGRYVGTWETERMVEPTGLAVAANGWLWVAEDRNDPKRILAWDAEGKQVVCEKFGTAPYGGSGAGVDPLDPTRWVGMGALWKLDLAKGTSTPSAVLGLGGEGSMMHYRFVRDHGNTYLIGMGNYTTIARLADNGAATPVAMITSIHRLHHAMNQKPPQVVIDAFNKAYPQNVGKHEHKGPGFLWSDANGDGEMQVDEFDFSTDCEDFAGGYFGHDFNDLTLRLPATYKGKRVIVVLKPEGFTTAQAPKYPKLNAAAAAGIAVDLPGNQLETTVDRFGTLICNSDPAMKAFAPDGKLLWTFPNNWAGVHGSHKAPLPEIGVMQGALFFLGTAPLDQTSDVFVMNGNHGRFFMLTSDGLYLDEFFKDVRMGARIDANLIGGEAFGGVFARSEKDGTYYLQAGSYRVFRVEGLDRVKRAQGMVTVTPAQTTAAERALARRAAAGSDRRAAIIPHAAKPPTIDGRDDDWAKEPQAAWNKSGQFPVSVRTQWDAANLYLFYEVSDNSPWVNNGNDWTLLFKTGDSVDLQIGTDASANPQRSGPVPGDLRLLIAPFQGKDLAVLYRHRVPGAKEPVTFTCPWRFEKVDVVTKLDSARIAVTKENGRYRVEAAIPLADLGLTAPAGKTFKTDVGVIFGDPEGKMNMLRSYWSNQNTGLVNDVPGEIMLSPVNWGTITFAGSKP